MWIKKQLYIQSSWHLYVIQAPGDNIDIVLLPSPCWQPTWDVPRFRVWEHQWQQHHGRSGQQQQQQLLQLQSSVFPMLLHEWLKKNKVKAPQTYCVREKIFLTFFDIFMANDLSWNFTSILKIKLDYYLISNLSSTLWIKIKYLPFQWTSKSITVQVFHDNW